MSASNNVCPHHELQVEVSSHATKAGFRRPDLRKRIAATTPSGRYQPTAKNKNAGGEEPEDKEGNKRDEEESAFTFPAPLVLPEDDLALDPKYPSQSLRSWLQLKERNRVTDQRKTIYIATVDAIADELSVMRSWTTPVFNDQHVSRGRCQLPAESSIESPKLQDLQDYLAAFYHGLPIKEFDQPFKFVAWGNRSDKTTAPSYIGLQSGDFCYSIRTRPCPDGQFKRQLNLNDMLDAAIHLLPAEAYAFLLLVKYDLYEDHDDDFCCGRAYGGSRVAIVSSARYHPALDEVCSIDRGHMWPASHCAAYIDFLSDAPVKRKKVVEEGRPVGSGTPMRAAVDATIHPDSLAQSNNNLYGLWLSRLARTTSHELGHCFGMDHCVYYACIMQGTAGMAEDVRQPPFLCPVCLKKLARAVLECRLDSGEDQYLRRRDMALRQFCKEWASVGMFAGFGAWLDQKPTLG
jgi:archaemetzincin